MLGIVDILEGKDKLYKGKSVSNDDIKQVENKLGLSFADEYKDYLESFGFVSYEGHELTGICDFPRLNVCDVTIEARKTYDSIKEDMYVIEDTSYDGILILQDSAGNIYQIASNMKPKKIFGSLKEYIDN